MKVNYDSSLYIICRVCKQYIRPYIMEIFLAVFFMLLSALSVSLRAYLIKPAIDKIFVNKDLVSLYRIPVALMIVAVLASISIYSQGVIMNKINFKISNRLQKDLFDKLIHEDMHFFKTKSVSVINANFSNVSGIIEIINIFLNGLFLQFFTLFFLIGTMLYQNWKMTIISFIAFPAMLLPLKKISIRMRDLSSKNMVKGINLFGLIGDIFENITIVRSSHSEEREIKKIDREIKEIYKIQKKISKKDLLVSPMTEMFGTIGFAGVILYGGISVIGGTNTAGEFFVFLTSLLSAYKPAKSFSGIGIKLQNSFVCAKRYFSLLDKENEVKEGTRNVEEILGDVEFRNVNFSYPAVDSTNKQVLFNLNFSMGHNGSYALVGHSGSGKSTIFNLLLRFYDVSAGEILIDNINIKNFNFKSLRRHISFVSQDVKLFDDTIYNNILYEKPEASREEVLTAARLANVEEFVIGLEKGYNTVVGPNGSLLSGGQKQRISIARAFLKNSPILLLDEATSALDPISENLIKQSIQKLMRDKTTIIIAHRLSTIMNCDRIFVFEQGKLMESGKHDELLQKDAVYKTLYTKQFTANGD